MKKVLTATAVLAALAVSATAQAATPYVEGQLGYANLGDVNASKENVSLSYDSDVTFGAEFGFKDVIVPNLRIGTSITTVKFDFNGGQVDGTPVTRAEAVADGYNYDARVNLYMVNAYYDFKTSTDFTPFVGFGLGVADVKISNEDSTEFAYSFNAGAKYNIDKNLYVGAKAAYTRVSGPTIEATETQDINLYTVNLSVGYEF